ncbi:hypothetical protein ASG12_07730 [Williamsia sp. Leaf354]|uniref:hypothetical protein n=1 Tax=Williamsia sp. Leaf354 TaxID=1736349 RepID=UPI0007006993|nr:hypothetical protein [Williamsia sp. Leaf354]KQS00741.1 hypothetical protein ASG12_07730 [Williamsia sp. Leaf354]
MPFDNEGDTVAMNVAYDAWEPHAVALLTDAATRYNDFVTYKQLSEHVQERSGITHKGLITNWIGQLLGRVIDHCVDASIPQLSALCVTSEGTVGEGYRYAIEAERRARGETPEGAVHVDLQSLDDLAARTRLECYRYFGAQIPPNGGVPTLTPKVAKTRAAARAKAKAETPPKLCPTHHTVLPVTGVCYECD